MKKFVLLVAIAFNLPFCIGRCEKVVATKEECVSWQTLGQAVIDRDLDWNQVLVCK